MKRLKLDVAPSNCTNDTELEITDEAGKSGSSSQDDLLSEIERDFAQDDREGPNVDTKLAIIVNMRWSSKLTDSKSYKEKWSRLRDPRTVNVSKLQSFRVQS